MNMDKGKLATAMAVCISTAAIFTSLGFVVRMHSEITELYQECMSDMEVFNVSFINFGSKLGYLVSIEYI
jgi:hypothetical protein